MNQTDYDGLKAHIRDTPLPLVVDLHAPWCGYCVRMQPDLDRLASERAESIKFLGLDTDEYPDAFSDLKVRTLPTVILFREGVEVARRGSGTYQDLSAWLSEHGL